MEHKFWYLDETFKAKTTTIKAGYVASPWQKKLIRCGNCFDSAKEARRFAWLMLFVRGKDKSGRMSCPVKEVDYDY